MHVTIIIPTYNERENIAKIVPIIHAQLPHAAILVVDDNSPDKTFEVVREMQKSITNLSLLLRQKKEGLGKAYINAFRNLLQEGKTDAVIMMDADFSHDPKYLPIVIEEAEQSDVVIGSRYVKGGKINDWNMRRKLLSRFGNLYARTIIGISIHDYTSGFVLIKTEMLRRIDLDTIAASGYAFLMELKSLLWIAGARVKEMPITLYDRTLGESKISGNIIREGLRTPWKIRMLFFKSSKPKEKYFSDSNFTEVKNKLILLDIDGTLVRDGGSDLEEKMLNELAKLGRNNKIYFCSNKKDHERNESLAKSAGVHYLRTALRKPSRKILEHIDNVEAKKIVVIGDKFLTDGLFAKNIGAEFIKIKRLTSPSDSWLVRLVYLIDDSFYKLAKKIWFI